MYCHNLARAGFCWMKCRKLIDIETFSVCAMLDFITEEGLVVQCDVGSLRHSHVVSICWNILNINITVFIKLQDLMYHFFSLDI